MGLCYLVRRQVRAHVFYKLYRRFYGRWVSELMGTKYRLAPFRPPIRPTRLQMTWRLNAEHSQRRCPFDDETLLLDCKLNLSKIILFHPRLHILLAQICG